MTPFTQNKMRSFEIGMSASAVCMNQYRNTHRRPAESIPALSERWFGKLMKLGQIASMHRWRKLPACTVRMAVHINATNALIHMAGKEPYMPKTLRMITGNGTEYVAPIFPVRVMTTLQMAKPKKTIGIVSRAVNPRAMTLLTVDAKGGANMSLHQYAQ